MESVGFESHPTTINVNSGMVYMVAYRAHNPEEWFDSTLRYREMFR
jgi:hypothetical protein